jgi:hypothetical protein
MPSVSHIRPAERQKAREQCENGDHGKDEYWPLQG